MTLDEANKDILQTTGDKPKRLLSLMKTLDIDKNDMNLFSRSQKNFPKWLGIMLASAVVTYGVLDPNIPKINDILSKVVNPITSALGIERSEDPIYILSAFYQNGRFIQLNPISNKFPDLATLNPVEIEDNLVRHNSVRMNINNPGDKLYLIPMPLDADLVGASVVKQAMYEEGYYYADQAEQEALKEKHNIEAFIYQDSQGQYFIQINAFQPVEVTIYTKDLEQGVSRVRPMYDEHKTTLDPLSPESIQVVEEFLTRITPESTDIYSLTNFEILRIFTEDMLYSLEFPQTETAIEAIELMIAHLENPEIGKIKYYCDPANDVYALILRFLGNRNDVVTVSGGLVTGNIITDKSLHLLTVNGNLIEDATPINIDIESEETMEYLELLENIRRDTTRIVYGKDMLASQDISAPPIEQLIENMKKLFQAIKENPEVALGVPAAAVATVATFKVLISAIQRKRKEEEQQEVRKTEILKKFQKNTELINDSFLDGLTDNERSLIHTLVFANYGNIDEPRQDTNKIHMDISMLKTFLEIMNNKTGSMSKKQENFLKKNGGNKAELDKLYKKIITMIDAQES